MSIEHRPTLPRPVSDHLVRIRKNQPAPPLHVQAVVDCVRILHYRRLIDDEDVLGLDRSEFLSLVRRVDPRVEHVVHAIRYGALDMVAEHLDEKFMAYVRSLWDDHDTPGVSHHPHLAVVE